MVNSPSFGGFRSNSKGLTQPQRQPQRLIEGALRAKTGKPPAFLLSFQEDRRRERGSRNAATPQRSRM
jgi:hypothetical protein